MLTLSTRMRANLTSALLFSSLLSLAACQGPDVGQACTMKVASIRDNPVPADVLEAGNAACDSLVCIKSPPQFVAASKVSSQSYCSKPCVSNDDCYNSDTGLVCRPVTVDPDYLATLPASVQAEYAQLLNCPTGVDLKTCALNSRYCAAPVK